jgi:uncharacterized membrane protein
LPVVITIYLIVAIFNFADQLLGQYINIYLRQNLGFYIPGLGLILSLLIIFLAGFLGTHLLGRGFFKLLEKWFLKFPLVRQIYPAAKQIVNFMFPKEKPSFKKVVVVEYPRKGIYSLGFLTNEGMPQAQDKTGRELLNVFIPSSPGPFTGFYTLVPKEEVIFLNISVEQAIKTLVSGGVLNP